MNVVSAKKIDSRSVLSMKIIILLTTDTNKFDRQPRSSSIQDGRFVWKQSPDHNTHHSNRLNLYRMILLYPIFIKRISWQHVRASGERQNHRETPSFYVYDKFHVLNTALCYPVSFFSFGLCSGAGIECFQNTLEVGESSLFLH